MWEHESKKKLEVFIPTLPNDQNSEFKKGTHIYSRNLGLLEQKTKMPENNGQKKSNKSKRTIKFRIKQEQPANETERNENVKEKRLGYGGVGGENNFTDVRSLSFE